MVSKIFNLKILKEDSSKDDEIQKQKDKMKNIVITGDSIALGMCSYAPSLRMATKKTKGFKGKYPNAVKNMPVQGATNTSQILSLLKNYLSKRDSWDGYSLIIIAGTNDAMTHTKHPSSASLTRAVRNIDSMVSLAKSLNFEKVSVMKIASYDPRGKYKYKKLNPEKKERHEKWISDFNNKISAKYKTFEMYTPTHIDGLHIYDPKKNENLFTRALKALDMKKEFVQIPISATSSEDVATSDKISAKDCHVNPNCNCIDRLIYDETDLEKIQKSLISLGFKPSQEGDCDDATRQAIMNFQKQQQQAGFKPVDGREFLRCDACVGVNTFAALKAALAKNKIDLSVLTSSTDIKPEEPKKQKIDLMAKLNSMDPDNKVEVPKSRKERIRKYYPIIKKWSEALGFPTHVAMGIAYVESDFNPSIRSSAGALGIMQLMKSTARDVGVDPSMRKDPNKNVQGALNYIVKKLPLYLEKDMENQNFNKGKIRWRNLTAEQKIRLQLYSYNMGARAAVTGKGRSGRFHKGLSSFDNIEDFFDHLKSYYLRKAGYDYSLKALNFARKFKKFSASFFDPSESPKAE